MKGTAALASGPNQPSADKVCHLSFPRSRSVKAGITSSGLPCINPSDLLIVILEQFLSNVPTAEDKENADREIDCGAHSIRPRIIGHAPSSWL